ncbi:MAG: hypothetical protein EA367_14220 [Leptolyngbya sp. DLM2.Bin15]|nr:MAG: hypothetical protein EA367_14220 [Leptolyngbya sp. DLM2.Bin15]
MGRQELDVQQRNEETLWQIRLNVDSWDILHVIPRFTASLSATDIWVLPQPSKTVRYGFA